MQIRGKMDSAEPWQARAALKPITHSFWKRGRAVYELRLQVHIIPLTMYAYNEQLI